jgi:hypothetical protein
MSTRMSTSVVCAHAQRLINDSRTYWIYFDACNHEFERRVHQWNRDRLTWTLHTRHSFHPPRSLDVLFMSRVLQVAKSDENG